MHCVSCEVCNQGCFNEGGDCGPIPSQRGTAIGREKGGTRNATGSFCVDQTLCGGQQTDRKVAMLLQRMSRCHQFPKNTRRYDMVAMGLAGPCASDPCLSARRLSRMTSFQPPHLRLLCDGRIYNHHSSASSMIPSISLTTPFGTSLPDHLNYHAKTYMVPRWTHVKTMCKCSISLITVSSLLLLGLDLTLMSHT